MVSAIAPVLLWGAGMAIAPSPVQGESLPYDWLRQVDLAIVERDFEKALDLQ